MPATSKEQGADPPAAAFFDVDNTVLQGASLFHLARGLYRRRFFAARDLATFGRAQLTFRVRGVETEGMIEAAQRTALSFVEGHTVDEMTSLGEEIYDEVLAAKIWPGTHALAQMHLDAGQEVWLVTATPVEVATVIAHRLGLTGALGSVAERVEGVYTGRLVGSLLHGPAKAEAVRRLAEERGFDLASCAAYSDSANDLPLLSLVGQPCAVNPDAKLRAHARAHGWRVRDFRTGRQAAKYGIPAAAGLGAAIGAVSAAISARRKGR
jgi:HAD superfamily hydrolase (TIGR01490 family)